MVWSREWKYTYLVESKCDKGFLFPPPPPPFPLLKISRIFSQLSNEIMMMMIKQKNFFFFVFWIKKDDFDAERTRDEKFSQRKLVWLGVWPNLWLFFVCVRACAFVCLFVYKYYKLLCRPNFTTTVLIKRLFVNAWSINEGVFFVFFCSHSFFIFIFV